MTANRKFKQTVRQFATARGISYTDALRMLTARPTAAPSLPELGFTNETLTAIRSVLTRQNAVVLIAGPTYSGKSTLLTAAAAEFPHGVALFDDVMNSDTLGQAFAAASDGRSVILTMHALSVLGAKHWFGELTTPKHNGDYLSLLTGVIQVRLVQTLDRQLAPVAGVWSVDSEPRAIRDDMEALIAAGIIDQGSADREYLRLATRPSA